MKRCSTCKQPRSPSSFYKNRTKQDGLHNQCIACHTSKPVPRIKGLSAQMLSPEDWMALVEDRVRRTLGISLNAFIQNLKDNVYGDLDDDPEIMRLYLLLPSDAWKEVHERQAKPR